MPAKRAVIVIGLTLFCAAALHAQNLDCADPTAWIILQPKSPPVKVSAPVCEQFIVNPLHYATNPMDPFSLPPFTAAKHDPVPTGPGDGPGSLQNKFLEYSGTVGEIEADLLMRVGQNRNEENRLEVYSRELNALIIQSDTRLNPPAADNPPAAAATAAGAVREFINSPTAIQDRNQAIDEAMEWVTVDEIVRALRHIQDEVNAFPLDFAQDSPPIAAGADPCSPNNVGMLNWRDWYGCEYKPYEDLKTKIATLIAEANEWTSTSDNARRFEAKVRMLLYWDGQITNHLAAADFMELRQKITCGPYTRSESIRMALLDRTSLFSSRRPEPTEETLTVDTQCTSAFALSAGLGLNFKENKQFGIVQSQPVMGVTMPEFGVLSTSKVNPYPLVMAHIRFGRWHQCQCGFYGSFGAGASINNSAAGGTSAEFLIGPSLSFHRRIFVTVGADLKKQSQLSGGYTVGEMEPTGVAAPVTSSYEVGVGVAFTFAFY